MAGSRILIVGLDGADPLLAGRWMDDGVLPNLSRLRERGVFAPLNSTVPPATLPAWTTFMTGMNPGRHGLVDFTRKKPGEYAVEFVNATHRRTPTMWRLMSDAGLRVGVMGVPGTYPPERLNGFQIGGFDSPVATRIGRRFVDPPELHNEIDKRFGFYSVAPFQELDIRPGWHERALPALFDNLEKKIETAEWLLRRERWDCFMALFGETDTVSHHFWMFHDPDSPRYDPERAAKLGNAIRDVYVRLDRAVGQLIEAAGVDANVIVVSDHGFGGAGQWAVYLNRWLEERGWLSFRRGGGLVRLARRIGPAIAPQRLQEALFRVGGGAGANRIESQSRFGGIDFMRTLAYSEELNYFPSIRLNIEGRDPQGALKPGAADGFVKELSEALEQWKHPETGQAIVEKVLRREEIYSGLCVNEAPDLILELALDRGYSCVCLPSPPGKGPALRKLSREELPGAKNRGMNGSHRKDGIFFAAGPGIRAGANAANPGLADLAPTCLALMGMAPMDGIDAMDGRRLDEILVETKKTQRTGPVKEQETKGSQSQGASVAEQEEIRKRLKSLGYL
jgi:predicted AlkP superfamily phosphohydrolase/phosphomutase